jgi:hypothetical protein
MEATSQLVRRYSPVCGISSIVVPFVGVCIGYIVLHSPATGDAVWLHIAVTVWLILASLLAGVVLAVFGMTRHERLRALPWVGFLLNAIPLLYIVATWK